MNIRDLFDPSKDIYRTIEKVITYGAAQEQRLKAEISEYVVTDSIDEQSEKLLEQDAGGDGGGRRERGRRLGVRLLRVWQELLHQVPGPGLRRPGHHRRAAVS